MKKIIALVMLSSLLTANLVSAATNAASYSQAQKAQTFISNQIKGVGLVDSYQEDEKDVSYVYDNALAAMACMNMNNYGLAKRIFDALCKKVQKDGTYGIPYESYNFNTGKPISYNLYSGNAAWLLQALNIYQKKQSSKTYYTVQKKLAAFLVKFQDSSDGAIKGSNNDSWKSAEHNIMAYVALRNFGRLNNLSSYVTKADKVKAFLTGSSIWDGERFNQGKNDTHRVTDVQALGTLLLGSSYSSALTYAEKYLKLTDYYNSKSVIGFDFNSDLDTVWLEGNLQMALAFYKSGNTTTGDYYYDEAAKTIQSDGSVILATSTGSASDWWTLQVWRAIAPTSWLIMYYNKFSPLTLY
ncbi:MAG TPA: hypothetical protein VJA84_02635 [Candidatus Omnitrophota bacterium]|nr:hypothetical protein [Candidatus Omnitrophota bacterium]